MRMRRDDDLGDSVIEIIRVVAGDAVALGFVPPQMASDLRLKKPPG